MEHGWRVDGCGKSYYSTSINGPWTEMDCESWADLAHDECMETRRPDTRTLALAIVSTISESQWLEECRYRHRLALDRCAARR